MCLSDIADLFPPSSEFSLDDLVEPLTPESPLAAVSFGLRGEV